ATSEDDDYRLFIVAPNTELWSGVGEALWGRLHSDLRKLGARRVWAVEYASETDYLRFLRERGFEEKNRLLDLRRSLAGPREPDAPPEPGDRITTLAAARRDDPPFVNKLIGFWDAVERAWHPASPSHVARAVVMRVQSAEANAERCFLALRGGEIVAVASL